MGPPPWLAPILTFSCRRPMKVSSPVRACRLLLDPVVTVCASRVIHVQYDPCASTWWNMPRANPFVSAPSSSEQKAQRVAGHPSTARNINALDLLPLWEASALPGGRRGGRRRGGPTLYLSTRFRAVHAARHLLARHAAKTAVLFGQQEHGKQQLQHVGSNRHGQQMQQSKQQREYLDERLVASQRVSLSAACECGE
jgi:hypothetical protein